MTNAEYHAECHAARAERDRVIAEARQAERRAYEATRDQAPDDLTAYSAAYRARRAIEDSAEHAYQARLLQLAGELEVTP